MLRVEIFIWYVFSWRLAKVRMWLKKKKKLLKCEETPHSAHCRTTSHSTFCCCSQRMCSVCSSVMNSRSRCDGFGWRRCRGCSGGHGGRSSFRCRWGRSLGRGDLDLLPVLPFLHHEGDENAQAHVATALLHLERGREQHSDSQRSSFRKPSLKFELFNFYWKLFSSAWH